LHRTRPLVPPDRQILPDASARRRIFQCFPYHYGILLKQRPGYSMATNNLSVIYDQIGATTKKISLLQAAVPLKDNSYVAANLAIAYAKAGFVDNASEHLQDIATSEQQEGIVRSAYKHIADQLEMRR
jgi:hypothetical protein